MICSQLYRLCRTWQMGGSLLYAVSTLAIMIHIVLLYICHSNSNSQVCYYTEDSNMSQEGRVQTDSISSNYGVKDSHRLESPTPFSAYYGYPTHIPTTHCMGPTPAPRAHRLSHPFISLIKYETECHYLFSSIYMEEAKILIARL